MSFKKNKLSARFASIRRKTPRETFDLVANQFVLKPLVASIALISSAPLLAQDDPAGVEEIVVTGFRSSLESALNIKRNSTGSVDSIVAEDIASFPDLNLAESMQRIPGVAISRVAGEGRNISVRGLGPEFTRVRINGMEAMASSGGTDAIGGANRGRGFDFNVFPSDLFSKLSVRKTASADVEEGSLGATVDMDTVRASDFDEFTLSLSGEIGYNDLSEESDPRTTFLVSNMFADGKIGLLLAGSYSDRNLLDEGASTVRWDNVNDFGSYQGDPGDPALEGINDGFRPRLPRYDSYTHEMERTGLAGSLEFLPTDATQISLDLLYSKHDATRNEIFMQGILNNNSIAGDMDVLSYTLDNTNTVTAASFDNAVVRSENRFDELSTEFTQTTLNFKHEFTDSLRMKAQIGQAKSEFDNPIQTTIVGEKSGLTFSYDYSGSNREDPVLVFDNEVGNLSGWATNSVRLRPLGAENTFDSASIDLEFDLNDNVTLKGGVLLKEFDFETFEARRASESDAGGVVLDSNTMMLYEPGLGSNTWAVPNLAAIESTYNIYSNSGAFAVSPENRLVDNYSAAEESTGIYAQLVFNTMLGDTAVRGDVGVRHVSTDQESTAYSSSAGGFITGKHDYTDTLPSVNLVFEPMDNVLIRASYAEVIARAGLASIRPNVSVSVSGGARTVSGGNPALEPTRAKTYDLATEIYFTDESMLSLAVFHKNLSTQVQTVSETKPYTETGLPIELAVAACEAGPGYGGTSGCDENVEWQVNSPTNAPGGPLYGFEASFQQPFTFLPGAFSNLGFIGNFTYVKAQLDYLNSAGEVVASRDLLGLSEDTTSMTFYYDDSKFGARISSVNRSGYLTHATGRNNNDREGTNGTTHIDASVSYSINDSFSVRFDALNLTNEVEDQWVDAVGNRLSYYHETGTQYYLGVQYKY